MKKTLKSKTHKSTHRWECKKKGSTSYRTLGEKYDAMPKSLNTPPPPKDKNNNHKIHAK